MVKRKMYPKRLVEVIHPRTSLAKLRDMGLIKYVNGNPVYTEKGLKYIKRFRRK